MGRIAAFAVFTRYRTPLLDSRYRINEAGGNRIGILQRLHLLFGQFDHDQFLSPMVATAHTSDQLDSLDLRGRPLKAFGATIRA